MRSADDLHDLLVDHLDPLRDAIIGLAAAACRAAAVLGSVSVGALEVEVARVEGEKIVSLEIREIARGKAHLPLLFGGGEHFIPHVLWPRGGAGPVKVCIENADPRRIVAGAPDWKCPIQNDLFLRVGRDLELEGGAVRAAIQVLVEQPMLGPECRAIVVKLATPSRRRPEVGPATALDDALYCRPRAFDTVAAAFNLAYLGDAAAADEDPVHLGLVHLLLILLHPLLHPPSTLGPPRIHHRPQRATAKKVAGGE